MTKSRDEQRKWQITRERFHIEDQEPPLLRRSERHIGSILTDIFNKVSEEKTDVPPFLIERWPMIIGEQVAKHTQPACLKKGILYIYTDHPGWLSEIRRLPKMHLLKKIASIPDIPEIRDIRFQLNPSIRTFWK